MKTEDLQQLYDNFHIFPANADKTPKVKWTKFRDDKIDFSNLTDHDIFGVICGAENLEVIDIDNHFLNADAMLQFIGDNFDLTDFFIVKTKNGGYHIYYRCEEIEGNQKLAQKVVSDKKLPDGSEIVLNSKGVGYCVLVETRGDGGYVIYYNDIIQGGCDKVPTISKETRSDLLDICRSLNEKEQKQEKKIYGKPGDLYNEDTESILGTRQLLESHGWHSEDGLHWRRPGKEDGYSATFGKVGINKFYVFSSNAFPFDQNQSYTMFGVKATLEHDGDYNQCAAKLAKKYGCEPQKQKAKPKQGDAAQNKKWDALETIIKNWKLEFRYNDLTRVLDYRQDNRDYQNVGIVIGNIMREMEVSFSISSISKSKIEDMIANDTVCKIYNPIEEFIENIPTWDGTDYFKELCAYIKLAPEESEDFFYNMVKKHMVRAIRCAIHQESNNRYVFVLHGPQKIGKTELFRWMMPFQDLYYEESINPADKDSILALSRYLIINMDELDSLNRKELSKLKAFISRGKITKRLAYGRHDQSFNRIASLFGSTNKTDILTDETNTRWIICKVLGFDWRGYIKNINPMMLWSQAYEEFKTNKEAGMLTKAEEAEQSLRNNQQFLETSVERDILLKYFVEDKHITTTATDIKIEIEKTLYPIKINFTQLTREMHRIYGAPDMQRVNGQVGRFYHLRCTIENVSAPVPLRTYSEREDDDNDVPF